jgi:hypothetical protein
MTLVANNFLLAQLQKRLPELAADLENDHFEHEVRVAITSEVTPAELELMVTVHNSTQHQRTPVKVGLEGDSYLISSRRALIRSI